MPYLAAPRRTGTLVTNATTTTTGRRSPDSPRVGAQQEEAGPRSSPGNPVPTPRPASTPRAADDDGAGIDSEEDTLFRVTVGSSVLESAGKELGDLLETVKREGWSRRESERVDRAIFTVIDDYDVQKMMQGISVPGPGLSPTVPWLPLVRPRSRRQHVRLESDALDADASAVPSGEPIRYKFDRTVELGPLFNSWIRPGGASGGIKPSGCFTARRHASGRASSLMEAAVEVEALRMETSQGMSLNRFGKEAAAAAGPTG
ncbi:hypothetical protein V8E54_002630 [Elaphomyces granulatus]